MKWGDEFEEEIENEIDNDIENGTNRSGFFPRRNRAANKERGREKGQQQLLHDYFVDDAVYKDNFRRRYRMRRELFDKICAALLRHRYDIWKQRVDCTGKLGFTTIQKVTAVLRVLAYGVAYDAVSALNQVVTGGCC